MEEKPNVTEDQYDGPSTFVHLHNHTFWSPLDGVSSPQQYASECEKRGYPAMSATEHGNVASIPDMYYQFNQRKLKFIAGCEIYYCDNEPLRQQKFPKRSDLNALRNQNTPESWKLYYSITRSRHLTVLAKNMTGYHNLLKLTTQAYKTGLFGMGRTQFPRIWFDKLCEYKEGLIILSGCINGPVSHAIRHKKGERSLKEGGKELLYEVSGKERIQEAINYVKKFKDAFGDDYFIELQMPGVEDDDLVFHKLIEIADRYKIKPVLSNDCHYLTRGEYEVQKIMMAIEQGMTVDDPNLFHSNSSEQYMKSRPELWATFRNGKYSEGVGDSDFHAMCDNTLLVADKCDFLKIDISPKIPNLENADNKLTRLVMQKLVELNLHNDTRKFNIDGRLVTYVEQARIELKRIIDKGFSSYFLITRDLVKYGRSKGWPFGPRGSAGGSLVCYLIEITSGVDPMLWGLSFDRFLSASRGGYLLNVRMPEPIKNDQN